MEALRIDSANGPSPSCSAAPAALVCNERPARLPCVPRNVRNSHVSAAVPTGRSRRVFVAYPYILPKADYRRPFNALAKAFTLEFEFADERITNKQNLDKITDMIVRARFSLFDITTWNANVELELGIARDRGRDYYLLFNPDHASNPAGQEVPADLGGLDRIQYRSVSGSSAAKDQTQNGHSSRHNGARGPPGG